MASVLPRLPNPAVALGTLSLVSWGASTNGDSFAALLPLLPLKTSFLIQIRGMINLPAGLVANYQAVALQEAFGLSLLVYALGHRPLFNVYTIIKPDLLSKPPRLHPCPCVPPFVHWSELFLTTDFKCLHRAPQLRPSRTSQPVYDHTDQRGQEATSAHSSFSFASFFSNF